MGIEQEPFRRYNPEPERENLTFTMRISRKEAEWIFMAMETLDIKSRGKAIKVLAEIGKNVLFTIFPSNLKYLFKKERVRLSDLTAGEIKKIKNCVTKD